MTELELQHLRREKWHTDGDPIRTLEQAREFVDSVGMAVLYPTHPMPLLPTFMGAVAGSERNLPERKNALGDPRALQVQELLARLVDEKAVFESQFGSETLLLSPTVFPYYYALASDRSPRGPIRSRARGKASPLTEHAFRAIEEKGPLTQKQLQEILGGALSEAAIARSLHELWAALKIARVGENSKDGNLWDVYYRWAPRAVEEGVRISDAEALSALISKYLDGVIAATQEEIANVFSSITTRARVAEIIHALLAARQFVYTPSETRTLITVAHSPTRSETPLPQADRNIAAGAFNRRRRNG